MTHHNILLDIEGTTTSIKFVSNVLFPYAREHVSTYLEKNWKEPEIQEIVALLKNQCVEDEAQGMSDVPKIFDCMENISEVQNSVVRNVLWQMDSDRKTSGLKALQGKIWKTGFYNGEIHGEVFEDVVEAFKRWKAKGNKIFIYSSGSIEAQKLLFGYSIFGDLTAYISGYFDTTTGPKRDSESYKTIATNIEAPPESFLFLTDIPAEAHAAQNAGMNVCLIIRPGNGPLSEEEKKLGFAFDFNNLQ